MPAVFDAIYENLEVAGLGADLRDVGGESRLFETTDILTVSEPLIRRLCPLSG